MDANQIELGRCYIHAGHGQCIVLRKTSHGFWIQVNGGWEGDKTYIFKGIKAESLSPIPAR